MPVTAIEITVQKTQQSSVYLSLNLQTEYHGKMFIFSLELVFPLVIT